MKSALQTPAPERPALLLLIPNLGLGGAQRVFADHARLLAGPYKVTECVFNLDCAQGYETANELHDLSVPGGGGPLAKIGYFFRRCQLLRQLKRARRVAISISHLEGADYVNLLSGVGERRVLCVHGSKLHDRNMRGGLGWVRRHLLIPLLYRQAARIVTVSAGIRAELVEQLGLPASKVQVINNFFDDEAIRQQGALLPPSPYAEVLATHPVLVAAGRLAPEKNLLALLKVFAQVRQRIPSCKLLLVGQGEQYTALLARCHDLNLTVYQSGQQIGLARTAAVLFAGYQSQPHTFIARATIFVLPSLNEGFPMALGEAMVCSRPVAAADCPTGPREMLAPGTSPPKKPLRQAEMAAHGVLLPVISNLATVAADEQVWVDTLVQLLADADRRRALGEQASQRMRAFTKDTIGREWLALLEKL
ncbi:glycosyltransferase [Hymenobacter artigasi]|uniref:Glycosyltransferase involved in cell wall biosynthesis n=1 Tax=Hymenobacter artigasi TaxID=2719616 RepID=A0ABX1HQL4_9BACT|nr:glycosyltransferase [Hymenobacter artigasi]NKI91477.1 glycosyltransferase involved in cell wall biosynthesis [Hymenobacter artigasi]